MDGVATAFVLRRRQVAKARDNTSAGLRRTVERRLEERGVPLRGLIVVDDPAQLRHPLPLRCDLRDGTFQHPMPSRRACRGWAG